MKKYSGNYTSKKWLLSETDIIKRSWKTAGEGKRSCSQFARPSPALVRVAPTPSCSGGAPQAGDQHLPLRSVETEQHCVQELPRSQPRGGRSPHTDMREKRHLPLWRSPFAGTILHIWPPADFTFPSQFSEEKCGLVLPPSPSPVRLPLSSPTGRFFLSGLLGIVDNSQL